MLQPFLFEGFLVISLVQCSDSIQGAENDFRREMELGKTEPWLDRNIIQTAALIQGDKGVFFLRGRGWVFFFCKAWNLRALKTTHREQIFHIVSIFSLCFVIWEFVGLSSLFRSWRSLSWFHPVREGFVLGDCLGFHKDQSLSLFMVFNITMPLWRGLWRGLKASLLKMSSRSWSSHC